MGGALGPDPKAFRRGAIGIALLAVAVVAVLLLLRSRPPVGPGRASSTGSEIGTSEGSKAEDGAPTLASRPPTPSAGSDRPPSAAPRGSDRRVKGRVLLPDGRPVSRGFVRWNADRVEPYEGRLALFPSRSDPVPVDGEGRFEITVPPPPEHAQVQLEARVAGFAQKSVDLGGDRALDQAVEIRLDAGPRIHGVARTADGTPVAGVTLRLTEQTAREFRQDEVAGWFRASGAAGTLPFGRPLVGDAAEATTDAQGGFEVRGLDSCRVVDCSWGWMLRGSGHLSSKAVENEVVLVPAACAAIHVVSAADDRPVSPRSLGVEIWTGAGSGVEPLGPDFAVQWPMADAPEARGASVEIEAAGYFPARVAVRAGGKEPQTDTTVRLRPLPAGPPGRLRVRLVTDDGRFREQHFQLELREAPATSETADGEEPAGGDGRTALVVERVEGVADGDDVVFRDVPAGGWLARIWGYRSGVAWSGDASIAAGRESSVTWVVAPHGAVSFEGAWPPDLEIAMRNDASGTTQVRAPGPPGRWYALPPGTWTLSWPSPTDPHGEEEVVIEVEAGKDHPLRWSAR